MKKGNINPLFQEATPEPLRQKICEMAALNYNPMAISVMLEGLYDPVKISARHIEGFLYLNKGAVQKARERIKKENPPTRLQLISKVMAILERRFSRANNDFLAFQKLGEEYREGAISWEQYQQKAKTLYMPTSLELINLINAIDKNPLIPKNKMDEGSAGTVEPNEEKPAIPEVDEERKAQIELAMANKDLIKVQELMFQAPKEKTPPQE